MSLTVSKDEGIRISVAALLSWIPLIPVFWFIVKPILVTAVSEAMASDVAQQIQKEAAPIKGAFSVLILRDISYLRKQIAGMEFLRDNPPADDWTADDAEDLVELQLELESMQSALHELKAEVE
jgi:hypothetical protein